ncbi:hypothetical protein HDK77DRAFT_48356 [Phyllosticta capitalensis]
MGDATRVVFGRALLLIPSCNPSPSLVASLVTRAHQGMIRKQILTDLLCNGSPEERLFALEFLVKIANRQGLEFVAPAAFLNTHRRSSHSIHERATDAVQCQTNLCSLCKCRDAATAATEDRFLNINHVPPCPSAVVARILLAIPHSSATWN